MRLWDVMQRSGTNNGSGQSRVIKALVFAVVIAIFWGLDTLAKRNVRLLDGIGLSDFRLFTEQGSSALAVWLLIPAVAWWLGRFPISRESWQRSVLAHLFGSALFAAAHYTLMIGMRFVVFRINDISYHFSDFWFRNLLIEWQKDLKIYAAAIGILIAFGHLESRRRQEKDTDDRLVVQSGSGERLISYDDIEFFEASRNYVSVHTDDHEYLLRQTLASLEESLQERHFLRTHRSFIVNQDRISGIENTAAGQDLVLTSGRRVPLSRSRRDTVKALIGL